MLVERLSDFEYGVYPASPPRESLLLIDEPSRRVQGVVELFDLLSGECFTDLYGTKEGSSWGEGECSEEEVEAPLCENGGSCIEGAYPVAKS